MRNKQEIDWDGIRERVKLKEIMGWDDIRYRVKMKKKLNPSITQEEVNSLRDGRTPDLIEYYDNQWK